MFEQIARGNVNEITKLLLSGIPVDVLDGSKINDSTLHWACSFGHTDVAKVLISHGFDVNIANSDGQTSLHIAAKNLNYELVELLLLEGANTDFSDVSGKTALESLPKEHEQLQAILQNPPTPTMIYRNEYENINACLLQNAALTASRDSAEDEALRAQYEDKKYQVTEDYDDEDDEAQDTSDPLLVFWPPTQRQVRRKLPPLVLSNAETMLICVASIDIDIFPLLTWSGLMDVLDRFGLIAQAKRSSPGAKIRLCVDKNICPGRHKYEIQIGPDQACLTASDSTGLLYAVYSFVQLLQLHSDIAVRDGVTYVNIPSITIRDWPDVDNRAVLWSYRTTARTSASGMKETIELLSRLRINMIFLVVDPDGQDEDEVSASKNNDTKPVVNNENKPSPIDNSTTRIYAIDEICRRHCVELVPTIVLNSINQTLPLEELKNFSHSMILLVLNYDYSEILNSLQSTSDNVEVNAEEVENACRNACEQSLIAVQQVGLKTVMISSNEWTRRTAAPLTIAIRLGLSAVYKNYSQMFPSALFSKPVICVHDFVSTLRVHSSKMQEQGSSLSLLPAFIDCDFMYPALLTKFYSFLHAGFAWNRNSTIDMIGDPSSATDFGILREVASLLLFTQQLEKAAVAYSSILGVFTGELLRSTMATDESEGLSFQITELVKVEKILWYLLNAPTGVEDVPAPNKIAASHCVRFYRRLLNIANWRLGAAPKGFLAEFAGVDHKATVKDSYDLEIDEFFSVIHILSVICRAIILSYTSLEKKQSITVDLKFGELLEHLAPGTKSDIANSLLESLEHCGKLWKRRYDRSFLLSVFSDNSSNSISQNDNDSNSKQTNKNISENSNKFRLNSKEQFLSQALPSIPASEVFRSISEKLPMPKNISKDNLNKLFVN